MPYEHTQSSVSLLILSVALLTAGAVALVAAGAAAVVVFIVLALVAVVGVGASSLTATVDDAVVAAVFRFGWPRRSIPVADIAAASTVRNRWYYGFGVRLIPGGWMYNVFGLDAVELELATGKKFRIGTDEPDALLAAITTAMEGHDA